MVHPPIAGGTRYVCTCMYDSYGILADSTGRTLIFSPTNHAFIIILCSMCLGIISIPTSTKQIQTSTLVLM